VSSASWTQTNHVWENLHAVNFVHRTTRTPFSQRFAWRTSLCPRASGSSPRLGAAASTESQRRRRPFFTHGPLSSIRHFRPFSQKRCPSNRHRPVTPNLAAHRRRTASNASAEMPCMSATSRKGRSSLDAERGSHSETAGRGGSPSLAAWQAEQRNLAARRTTLFTARSPVHKFRKSRAAGTDGTTVSD
jgi:hypothetical protein